MHTSETTEFHFSSVFVDFTLLQNFFIFYEENFASIHRVDTKHGSLEGSPFLSETARTSFDYQIAGRLFLSLSHQATRGPEQRRATMVRCVSAIASSPIASPSTFSRESATRFLRDPDIARAADFSFSRLISKVQLQPPGLCPGE